MNAPLPAAALATVIGSAAALVAGACSAGETRYAGAVTRGALAAFAAEHLGADPAVGVAAAGAEMLRHDDGHGHDDTPFADCPLGHEARDSETLLDTAADRYDARDFAAAFACADIAADVVPQSVEAHHVRAAALAAMGRHDEAQVAFSMALALDPDDPETLAAAADFYINVMPPKRRETTQVGLEFARRGGAHAVSRRRKSPELRARLALLEAQALNDLGHADEALETIDDVVALAPDMIEAMHERGVSYFNLCRFDAAKEAFIAVLRAAPDDPYAHHHLGLIYEREGRAADAEAHFARAREHPESDFWPPVEISAAEFRAEVDEALGELPDDVRELLEGVAIEVAPVPALEDLTAVDPPFSPTILGLFRGLPHGIELAPEAAQASRVPSRAIVLYRMNLARAVRTRDELDAQIRRTLLHEIGHLTGLDEDDLRRRGLD